MYFMVYCLILYLPLQGNGTSCISPYKANVFNVLADTIQCIYLLQSSISFH